MLAKCTKIGIGFSKKKDYKTNIVHSCQLLIQKYYNITDTLNTYLLHLESLWSQLKAVVHSTATTTSCWPRTEQLFYTLFKFHL